MAGSPKARCRVLNIDPRTVFSKPQSPARLVGPRNKSGCRSSGKLPRGSFSATAPSEGRVKYWLNYTGATRKRSLASQGGALFSHLHFLAAPRCVPAGAARGRLSVNDEGPHL